MTILGFGLAAASEAASTPKKKKLEDRVVRGRKSFKK
jgi:hypothetical protein